MIKQIVRTINISLVVIDSLLIIMGHVLWFNHFTSSMLLYGTMLLQLTIVFEMIITFQMKRQTELSWNKYIRYLNYSCAVWLLIYLLLIWIIKDHSYYFESSISFFVIISLVLSIADTIGKRKTRAQ